MIRLLPWLLTIALLVYALVDCVQCDEAQVRYLPKAAWVLLIVLFPVMGSLAWLIAGSGRAENRRGRTHPPAAPRGPDDDPDFLRRL